MLIDSHTLRRVVHDYQQGLRTGQDNLAFDQSASLVKCLNRHRYLKMDTGPTCFPAACLCVCTCILAHLHVHYVVVSDSAVEKDPL